MNFYIFRHGQTDWNKEWRIQGSSNIPLNAEGRSQALALAQKFKAIEVDIILSSDLDRAYDTALAVSQVTNTEVVKDRRLREAFFGEAEGKTVDEIKEKYGADMWENFRKMSSKYKDQCFPGGETRGDSVLRMRSVVDECIKKNTYRNIALSTHGGVVRNLLHSYLPEDAPSLAIPNCVLYLLRYENGEFNIKGPL
jgi:probable phosphoglycerate mutase